MTAAAFPENEQERLAALRALSLLDTPPEERFDRITRLATRLFDVPVALVSLVDEDRQWFKANEGLDAQETSRRVSFCAHAILEASVMVVPDATKHPTFQDNELVVGAPGIRFYAGYPLRTPDGHAIGTLCLIDYRPREFDATERSSLSDLGKMVERELTTEALANTDSLTRLRNRRGFEVEARSLLAAAGRMGVPVTLVFIDLDDFKSINDKFGHPEGDRALQSVSTVLSEVFRSSDVIARIGGDEFCILLSGTDEAAVQEPLSRLAAALTAKNRAAEYAINYSSGIVSFEGEATTIDLLAEADRRMYRQKRRTGATTTKRELAQVLLELAGSLTDPGLMTDRMDRLCRQTVELLGCDRSSVFRWDGRHYRAMHNHGNPPDIAEHFADFRVDAADPLIAAAFSASTCIAINDAAGSEIMNPETARRAQIRSIAVAPMSAGEEPLGFMTAEYNERSGVFSDLDATLLQGISRLAAGVMQGPPDQR